MILWWHALCSFASLIFLYGHFLMLGCLAVLVFVDLCGSVAAHCVSVAFNAEFEAEYKLHLLLLCLTLRLVLCACVCVLWGLRMKNTAYLEECIDLRY